MRGEPMAQAKQAFQWALKDLKPGDRFNVIVFDGEHSYSFFLLLSFECEMGFPPPDLQEEFAEGGQLVPVDENSVNAATHWY